MDCLGGLFYLRDEIKRNENFAYFGPESPQYAGGTAGQFPWSSTDTDSYAVFAQGGYRVTDKLKVTAGARWSTDKKVSPLTSSVLQTSGAITNSFAIVREKSWQSSTGLLSVSYDWRDDFMTYASYSTGFKAGGFQSTVNPIVSAQPFDPEEVAQIEIGLKSMWFDRRLRANVAAYTLDYSDLQVNNQRLIDNRAFSLIGNAAGADVRGVDVDLLARVTDGLTLGVNYSWIPTARIKGFSSIAGFPSIEGFRIPRTPKNSYTLSAEYSLEALPGDLTLGADYVYRSDFVNEMDATVNFDGTHPVLPSAGYALLNLHSDYSFGAWTLSAYVRNALNKEYFPSSVGNGGTNRYYVRAVGAPRTWEISLERKF